MSRWPQTRQNNLAADAGMPNEPKKSFVFNLSHSRTIPTLYYKTKPIFPTPSPVQSGCMRRSFVLLLVSSAIVFAQRKPFDVNAMLSLKRISDPQISPDGKLVAFTVQIVDVEANKKPMQ